MSDFKETLNVEVNENFTYSWCLAKIDNDDGSVINLDFDDNAPFMDIISRIVDFCCQDYERVFMALHILTSTKHLLLEDEY